MLLDPAGTPEARFAAVVASLAGQPGVTPPADGLGSPRRFGAAGLKVRGRVFAMLVRERLVVKLPKARVDALVATGDGERYDPRRDGRLMQEWLVVAPEAVISWQDLATEALAFVDAHPPAS